MQGTGPEIKFRMLALQLQIRAGRGWRLAGTGSYRTIPTPRFPLWLSNFLPAEAPVSAVIHQRDIFFTFAQILTFMKESQTRHNTGFHLVLSIFPKEILH